MLTTLLIAINLWRSTRTRRKIERLLTLGPEWAHPRACDTEIISDDERERWRSMGPIR